MIYKLLPTAGAAWYLQLTVVSSAYNSCHRNLDRHEYVDEVYSMLMSAVLLSLKCRYGVVPLFEYKYLQCYNAKYLQSTRDTYQPVVEEHRTATFEHLDRPQQIANIILIRTAT